MYCITISHFYISFWRIVNMSVWHVQYVSNCIGFYQITKTYHYKVWGHLTVQLQTLDWEHHLHTRWVESTMPILFRQNCEITAGIEILGNLTGIHSWNRLKFYCYNKFSKIHSCSKSQIGCASALANFRICLSGGPMVQHYCHGITISIHPSLLIMRPYVMLYCLFSEIAQ